MATAVVLAMAVGTVVPAQAAMSILDTKHNLSVLGPGTIKSTSMDRVCVFCHTPHRAGAIQLLWNRSDSTATYTLYGSTTLPQAVGQPTGSSRMCLSCHDGTIALGLVASSPVEIPMTQRFLDTGAAALNTDLSDDHPISFVYDQTLSATDPEYLDPTLLMDEVTLDDSGELQCTSCHDPHDDTYGKFLVMDATASALCLACHQPTGWVASPHASSVAIWDGTLPDPWPHTTWTTVADNGCDNCHRPHGAGGHARLLNTAVEEDNCLPCHDGHVAALDVAAEFRKPSVHPVANTVGVHNPKEDPATMGRHVECVDCHNPHQAKAGSGSAPAVSGPLTGVSGVDATGVAVATATNQYEVCFKCHGDTASGTAPVVRQISELNKRLQFDVNNPSFHPVEGPGVNPNVPSLLLPMTAGSVIYCTDCHANNSGPGAGGSGPAGPHGSIYPHLLERQYITADGTAESSLNYALCYKCHNRTSILNDESFTEHKKHVQEENAPCSVCHDPHGISGAQGNTTNNAHLINFDTAIVAPNSVGLLKYESLGSFSGRCYLSCHGHDHNPEVYP